MSIAGEELASYFTEGSYRFEMRLERGSLAAFYTPTPEDGALIAQRRKLLDDHASRHLAVLPEAQPLLAEISRTMAAQNVIPRAFDSDIAGQLGRSIAPDFLVLKRAAGTARLVCGCVCFPSSWSLIEKVGLSIDSIHEIVPGLNSALGSQIVTFLHRLKPGISWTRSNWGLSRHPDLNQHPDLNLPRLDSTVSSEQVYFRVEEQSLAALPENDGVLFGIRLKVFPLRFFSGTKAAGLLAQALETMPEPMAAYKGIAEARPRILSLLRN